MNWVSLVLGAIGTALGILNFSRQIHRDRVHVRVRLKRAYQRGPRHVLRTADVANTGATAVTISAIGLMGPHGNGLAFLANRALDGRPSPWRLEPHSSVSIPIALADMKPEDAGKFTHLYASTADGIMVKTRLKKLREVIRAARSDLGEP
jgi:hypothetical protein